MAIGNLPKTFVLALTASAAMHSTVMFFPFAWHGNQPGAATNQGAPLQASLVTSSLLEANAKADSLPIVAPSLSPTPSAEQAPTPAPNSRDTPLPPPLVRRQPSTPTPAFSTASIANLQVYGRPLEDRSRLGELLSREMSEFPVEVDIPVRPQGEIHVAYPPSAMQAGREDSVAVWIVVDASGAAEEITITEGSEEFAQAVVLAIKDAQFLPARNSLQPIRFPLALEFRFAINAPALAGVKSTDK